MLLEPPGSSVQKHPHYHGRHGLSETRMKRKRHGAHCAIKMHSTTSNVAALP